MKGQQIPIPTYSLDPVEWWMYCDLLLDAGFPSSQAQKARRVGDSLARESSLTLVLYCEPAYLDDHWLRVGKTWFIPVDGTYLDRKDRFQWWRKSWIKAGFHRYPYDEKAYPERKVEAMIALASGTPWEHGHPEFDRLRERHQQRLIDRFFASHSLRGQPDSWR